MISNENRRGLRTPLEDWRGPQSKTRRFLESSGSNWTTSSFASTSLWSRSTASKVIGVHRKLPGSLQLSYEKATRGSPKHEAPGARRADLGEWGLDGRRKVVTSGDPQDLAKLSPLSEPRSPLKPQEADVAGVFRFPLKVPRIVALDAKERRNEKPRVVQRPSPYIANAFRDRGRTSKKAPNRRNPSKYKRSRTNQRTITSYDMEMSRVHFSRKPKHPFEPRGTKHSTTALKTIMRKENLDYQRGFREQYKQKECTDVVSRIIKQFRYDDKKKEKEKETPIHPFSDDPIRPRSLTRSRSPLPGLLFTHTDELPWNKKKTRRGETPLPPLKFTYEPSILATEHLVHKFYPSTTAAPTGHPPMDMHLDFDYPKRKPPMSMGDIIKSVYKNERKLRAVQKIGPLSGSRAVTSRRKAGLEKTRDEYANWRDPILTPNEEVRGIYKKIIYKGDK